MDDLKNTGFSTRSVQNLEDDGFTMVPFGRGFRDMSPPSKELMRIVLEHNLAHGGHPVLRWNMDNAFVRTHPARNIKIGKEKSTEKVRRLGDPRHGARSGSEEWRGIGRERV